MRTVMIVNPDSQHFLTIGNVLSDGRDWVTADIGYGQPCSFERRETMDVDDARRMLKQLVRVHMAIVHRPYGG